MAEPTPEHLPHPELSPDQLAEIEAIVDMSEDILVDPEVLVADEDQPDFQIGPAPVTPYHTEQGDRMYWSEPEWPQVVGLMAERFGITAREILDADPGTGNLILASRSVDSAIILLGITRTTDEVEIGHVPLTLAVTTEAVGWEPR